MSDQEKVLVPALVGLEVGDAHELAFTARVVVVAPDPAVPLPTAGVVTAQQPSAGTRVEPAHPIVVAVDPGPGDEGGGGGGGGGGGRPLTTPPPGPLDPAGTKPVG
ncbi:MAG: hypothetical protein ACRDQ0_05915 [Pseudonocardia sp.]